MNEARILSACFRHKEAIELIPSTLEFTSIARGVLELLKEYYELDPEAQFCPPDAIMPRMASKFQETSEFNAAWDFLDRLPSDVSLPNLTKDIRDYNKSLAQRRLTNCLAVGTEPEINQAIEDYVSAASEANKGSSEEAVLHNLSVSDVVNKHFTEAGTIKLWPKQLNDLCDGGARPGHHILIFARPEIGKTLFVINMVAGFLHQGLRVLYCGNEDPASDLLLRLVGRLSKRTKHQIIEDPDKTEILARENGYENLFIASLAPGNFQQIRRLAKQNNSQVVVLDQLRNLYVSSESRTTALEALATEARNLAKSMELLVVSITQAGESAEGKAQLGRSDVDGSKTGIPAQADLMVGIGADPSMERAGFRTISLPKNKLSGKHDSFTCSIDPTTGVVLNG